jgi:hypothetical protein
LFSFSLSPPPLKKNMVLNLFKTLASKNEAAHHRTQNHHQSR